ncbi:GntR family transcriptional regulator [Phycisphaerales bacterium AB-hyl4]|uniref:GntR family transcriptional regulator n=1 Tax=Natronomicrosphaera hydrolytica TaxID=3242702 RepID=A0ABV4U8R4_9BACT
MTQTIPPPDTSYGRVASVLRDRILRGEWEPTKQLPTEQALCSEFDVSRITIRQALQILDQEQLIYRRQGSGSFVNERPTRRIPLLQAGFSQSIKKHAPELTRKVLRFARRRAGHKVGRLLNLSPEDRVVYARRLDVLDGKPVAYDDLYLPEACGDQLDLGDLETVAFAPQWKQVQSLEISHMHQKIDAVNASAMQARLLAVQPRAALLKTIETPIDKSGRPLGLFVTYYHGRVFSLSATCQSSI